MRIRPATAGDLAAIRDIYNVAVRETTAAWSERPQTLEERSAWFDVRTARGDGVYVAVTDGVVDVDVDIDGADGDGPDGRVVGFAAYGDFRDTAHWPGYRFTVENTVHVLEPWWGVGAGRALMEALIDHATAAGKHAMIAAVDGENEGSVRFHERLGFRQVGRLPEVGWKFDHWLDLVLLLRPLDPANPANPRSG